MAAAAEAGLQRGSDRDRECLRFAGVPAGCCVAATEYRFSLAAISVHAFGFGRRGHYRDGGDRLHPAVLDGALLRSPGIDCGWVGGGGGFGGGSWIDRVGLWDESGVDYGA